jgi:hypothetical protein
VSYAQSPAFLWTEEIKALKPGDACEWRPMARPDWRPGTVIVNGGSGYWTIRDAEGKEHRALYAENVKAKDGHHYEDER